MLPCFGDSVAGKSSRLPQCELTSQFWQLVRKWKVQSQWVHRDFRSSTRDSLASETSNREKHLEIFSKLLAWSVLAGVSGDYLATYLSREKCVFCTVRAIFKIFFSFPSNFLWLFIFSLNYFLPKRLVTHFKLHCCFLSTQNLQVTGMSFLSRTLFYLKIGRASCRERVC